MAEHFPPALYRIARLVRKEFWQLRSDKAFAALLITVPLMLLFLVVNVAGGEARSADLLAVIDQDHSASSRRLIAALENTGELRVHLRPTRLADGDQALFSGAVQGLIVIPTGFERDLYGADAQAELSLVVDGSNTFVAGRLLSTVNNATQSLLAQGGGGQGPAVGIGVRPTKYFEITRLQSRLAAQLGFLLYQVVLMVAGIGIVRECESGTLEQLLVTPITKFELILGKMLPMLLVGVVDFWLLFWAAYYIWDMPVRGSLGLLFGIAILFILAESAWGLFLSSRVTKQQQATQLIFVQILFDMAFCGYVVPVDNLPRFLSWISDLLPLRHYIECVRTILLRGGDAQTVTTHIAALVGLNLVFWTLSVTSLRQRLQ